MFLVVQKVTINPYKNFTFPVHDVLNIIFITILQVKTYIVAPLEGKSHTKSSTIGVMT